MKLSSVEKWTTNLDLWLCATCRFVTQEWGHVDCLKSGAVWQTCCVRWLNKLRTWWDTWVTYSKRQLKLAFLIARWMRFWHVSRGCFKWLLKLLKRAGSFWIFAKQTQKRWADLWEFFLEQILVVYKASWSFIWLEWVSDIFSRTFVSCKAKSVKARFPFQSGCRLDCSRTTIILLCLCVWLIHSFSLTWFLQLLIIYQYLHKFQVDY